MMWIQAILIVVGVTIVVWFLRSGRSSAISASKKLGLLLLGVAVVVSVLNPSLTTRVAQWIGVGRGADLLLYALTMAFLAYALTQYTNRQRDLEVVHRLARRVALLEATETYGTQPTPPEPQLPPPDQPPALAAEEEPTP